LRWAWDEWWSQRNQVLVKTVKTALLIVYLISLFMFFGTHGSGSMRGFRAEIGYPTPWFLFEKLPAEQGGAHSIAMNYLSAAWLVLGLGILAYYIHTRIAKVDGTFKLKEHRFVSTWLPIIMAAFAVIVAVFPLILRLFITKPQ
jgi:hypothetical protein